MLYEHHVRLSCGHHNIITLYAPTPLKWSATTCSVCPRESIYKVNGRASSNSFGYPRRTITDCAIAIDESS